MPDVKFDADLLVKRQLDTVFGNSRLLVVGHITTASIVVYWLWGQVPLLPLLVWYVFSFVHPVTRSLFSRQYWRAEQWSSKWRKHYLFGSALNGFTWGSLVLFDVPLLSYYVILIVLAGLTTITVATSSIYRPAVTFYVIPIGIATTLKGLYFEVHQPGQGGLVAGLISLAYVSSLLWLSRVSNRSLLNGIRLEFKNTELVSQLTEQQQALIEAKDAAEQASADKSRFLAAASHDLRQPLHSMGLIVDALKYAASEEEADMLQGKLEQSVVSLTELFDALLDISKLDANSIDIQVAPIRLSDLTDRLMREFEVAATAKQIGLTSRQQDLIVDSDPIWLERIVRNLLSNALRYTEAGRVLLTARKQGAHCLLQIWDSGIGIPEDQQGNIFREFTQLHNPQRDRTNGLGLGLSIVKRLCDFLGYRISVRSIEGRGSVFSVTLPVSAQSAPQTLQRMTEPENSRALSLHVLIIDDEVEVRETMAIMLAKWGCSVLTAESAASAIVQMEALDVMPQVIVSDYRLANHCTGVEAVVSIRERFGAEIPAVLVTGETGPKSIREIQASGFKVLHKPVRPAKLRIMLNSLA